MKQCLVPVVSNKEISPGNYLMWLEAPQVTASARPGQFIMINCEERLLRRPLSIHRIAKNSKLALLYSVIGKGTEWLSEKQTGDTLDILGPLGNGFTVIPQSKNLLLLAGGIGIAPLLFLADTALEQILSVTIIQGAFTATQLYPGKMLPGQVQFLTFTEDGSQADTKIPTKKGMVTDYVAESAHQFDQIFACGPAGMYRSLKKTLEIMKYKYSAQISLDVRMGCGLGACYGCSIRTNRGMKKVCQDGPIFELSDISPEEIIL